MPDPESDFPDHFSAVAAGYAEHRPSYPPELFRWLATLPERRRRAWDCGTGNGQAAVALAEHFGSVVASDASAAQVAAARPHPRVEYRVAPAEASGLPAGSVDLVTVAQAVHWFDHDRFWPEVERVLAPGGAVAVWTYELCRVTPAVDRVVERFYHQVVGPFWPPERRWVETGYRDLPFPFDPLSGDPLSGDPLSGDPLPGDEPPPRLEIRAAWPLERFAGYLGTWSASRRWAEARLRGRRPHGEPGAGPHRPPEGSAAPEAAAVDAGTPDAVAEVWDDLAAAWGDPARRRTVTWPLAVRAGRPRGAAG